MTPEKEALAQSRRAENWRNDLRKSLSNKERISIPRTPMRTAPLVTSAHGLFIEEKVGYDTSEALAEARRCLDCPSPGCQRACPAHINIPSFIKNLERGNMKEAWQVLRESSTLSAICGRVCDQERQCEGGCIYAVNLKKKAVSIGDLERYVATYESTHRDELGTDEVPASPLGIPVAVIGSGPAGLAAAHDLALLGYSVVVYEALDVLGGVMRTGIPRFRLPVEVIEDEVQRLERYGVRFVRGVTVGRDVSIESLWAEGYKAIFVGTGAGVSGRMNIEGEELPGVYISKDYLMRTGLALPETAEQELEGLSGKNVVVIGGGNTAMDVVRTAIRLGAERAIICYRRGREEMSANREETEDALHEGAELMELHVAHHYEAGDDGRLAKMVAERIELGEPDGNGKRSPIATGDLTDVAVDKVIVAVGVYPDPLISEALPKLETAKGGRIIVDEGQQTNIPHLYAGGDITRGGATVVQAMADGRRAARSIHASLSQA